ncbi:MAG: hypothetical protein IK020_03260 [Clostridiales bacterium]|nr:hypothetical protein [Clostridiales bacterium]
MNNNKRSIILISVLVVLGIILIIFKVLDGKRNVIERKTGYEVPSYFTIEKYVAYGSMFHRTGFEAKIKIDSVEHMNETIDQMHQKLGDNHHEIDLSEYNIEKYALFSGEKLIPEPSTTSWVIVGPAGSGTLVVFMCIENQLDPYMYMYYND